MIDTHAENAAPPLAWRDLKGWQQVASALRLVIVALALGLLAMIVYRLWNTSLTAQLRAAAEPDTMDQLFDELRFTWQLFPAIGIMSVVAIAIGAFRISLAPLERSVRVLGIIACVAIALEVVHNGLWWLQAMSEKPQPWLDLLQEPWMRAVVPITSAVYFTCLLLMLVRLSAAVEAPVPRPLIAATGAWIAWDSGFALYRVIFDVKIYTLTESPWTYLALTLTLWALGQVLFIYLVGRLSLALKRPAPDALGTEAATRRDGIGLTGNWASVADGLELYTSALAWRVFGTIGAYLFLIFGVFGRSRLMLKLVAFAMPSIALITAVVMVVGIARYARQPDDSEAGMTAWIAAALMGFGLLLEGFGLLLVIRQLSLDEGSWTAYSEMREIADQAQTISMWAMGLGFVSLLALMLSFGQLTRYIKRPDLSSRVLSIGLFMGFVAVVVLGFRSYVSNASDDPGGMVVMGIMIALTAIIAVFAYLNLVNNIAEAVRPESDSSDLPTARVVS